jgi:DNA-binding SARP family transcriptional activator/DNA-binding XRE family transcriptional regulator
VTGQAAGADEPSIGSLIRQQRTAHRLTQHQLAQSAGVSIGSLRDVEQGRTLSPRWELLRKVAAVLGFDPEQLSQLVGVSAGTGGERSRTPAVPSPATRGACLFVLGPLVLSRNGAQVALGSGLQRGVLGLLAVERGSDVPPDAIVDALWGRRPPKSARAMVQRYVWQLRNILAEPGERPPGPGGLSITGNASYRLEATRDQLDLSAFEQLTRLASAAADASDPAAACELYERGLSLWRGEALADIDLLHDHPTVVGLAAAYADAVLRHAGLAARLGRPGRALPHLRRLCGRDGFDEPAHARLMTVLAAAGHQVEALQVYTNLRRRLRSEFGIDPSPVVVAAQAAVLRQRPEG